MRHIPPVIDEVTLCVLARQPDSRLTGIAGAASVEVSERPDGCWALKLRPRQPTPAPVEQPE
jgi:hypothetical protein